jgi:hypothetical protein
MIVYGSQPQILKPGAGQIMSVFDERQRLDGLQKLDSQAISAIYDQYFPEVYRYVRYRINDDRTAEDIASDVFVHLLEAVQKKQGPQSSLKGWLIATASHSVNDHFRRQYRRWQAQYPFRSGLTGTESHGAKRLCSIDLRTTACAGFAFRAGILSRRDGRVLEEKYQRCKSSPIPGTGVAPAADWGGKL